MSNQIIQITQIKPTIGDIEELTNLLQRKNYNVVVSAKDGQVRLSALKNKSDEKQDKVNFI